MTPAAPDADEYRRLTPAERRIVRRVEATCRATGRPPIDAIALQRLERAAAREQRLGRFARWLHWFGPTAQERVERLRCTLRHPSRTGAHAPARCGTPPTATS